MTCSKNLGRLLQASCLGLITTLAVVGCGGSENGKDGGTGGNTGEVGTPPGQPSVAVIPATLDLGSVDLGKTSSAPAVITVTNKSPAPASLTPTVTGPFTISDNCAALGAAPATCTIQVSFVPTVLGQASGTVIVAGNVKVSLSAIGTPAASFTMTDRVDLQVVPASATLSGKVNITATSPLKDLICSVVGADLTTDVTGTTCVANAPLAAGASCVVAFNFMSATPGVKSGNQVLCNAGGVSKTATVAATVVGPAKLIVNPPSGAISATVGMDGTQFVFNVANSGGVNSGAVTAAISPAPEFSVASTTCAAGLAPLATCTVTVVFKPTAAGPKTATLTVTDASAPTTPATATLSGVAVTQSNLVLTGGVADFGSLSVGTSGTPSIFTLKNTGGEPADGVSVVTSDAQFVLGSNTCAGVTLPATTGSCTFTVAFAPTTLGAVTGLVTANSSAAKPTIANVKGAGIKPPTLSITPSPLAFDGIPLNVQSEAKTLIVTNTGAATTGLITVPTGLGNGFVISGNTCSAALEPATTCTIAVRFTPNAISQATFTLTVSSASGAVGTALLTGTGRQPNVLSITPVNVTACSATTPTSPCFSDTIIGQADGSWPLTPAAANAPVTFTITNTNTASNGGINLESGLVTVVIGGANAADFEKKSSNCGPTLQPSQSCVYIVSFAPKSATGDRVATLSATSVNGGTVGSNMAAYALPAIEMVPCGWSDDSSPPVAATKAACAAALLDTPNIDDRTGLDFGQVSLGANCKPANVKWFLVTINSSTAADHMNLISAVLTDAGTPSNFRIATDGAGPFCNNLNADTSDGAVPCWIAVQFFPQGTAKELKNATVSATGASGGSASKAIKGTSTGPLTISPSTAEFGTVIVNEVGDTADIMTLTVNNWSTTVPAGPLTISPLANADFRLVFDSCTQTTLSVGTDACTAGAANSSCMVAYRFYPSVVGDRTVPFTVTSDTQTSGAVLHGTGVPETAITAAPAALAFSNIVLTQKSDFQTVTVTAGPGGTETGTLQFDLIGNDSGQFQIAQGGDSGTAGTCGLTDTIRLGGANPMSCTIKVRFVPTAADGLGLQQAFLRVLDPRDRTLTRKIALTGTGTSQLTITPTTADFSIVAATENVATQLTFTLANIGTVAVTPLTLTIDGQFDRGYAGNETDCSTSIAAGATCVILVTLGDHDTAGFISVNPAVTVTSSASFASSATAQIAATVQTDADLQLVGIDSGVNFFDPVIDLGSAASGANGGTVTLLYRNMGGHNTSAINYYFYKTISATSTVTGTKGSINTADVDGNFSVIAPTSETDPDNCFSNVFKNGGLPGGRFCKVQVRFNPTSTGQKEVGFQVQTDIAGSPHSVALKGFGRDTSADKLTITPAFYSFIQGAQGAITEDLTIASAQEILEAPAVFTITNNFTVITTISLATTGMQTITASGIPSANFVRVAAPAGAGGGCDNAALTDLDPGAHCFVWVKHLPQVATGPFQFASLAVKDVDWTGTTYTSGMMGKVRVGTVLSVWPPATGVKFGKVPRQLSSTAMGWTVMSIGDSPTTGNTTMSILDASATPAGIEGLFTASGCGSSAGTLAAFNMNTPSAMASCAAQVVLSPGNATVMEDIVTGGAVKLRATANGTDETKTATTADTWDSGNGMNGDCVYQAALTHSPADYSFADVQPLGTSSLDAFTVVSFVTITNGAATSTFAGDEPDTQTTSAITFSLTEGSAASTNFILDQNPTYGGTFHTCQVAKNQVTGALTLLGNQSCVVGVVFAPQAKPADGWAYTATLTATASTGGSTSLTLTGTGRDDLKVTSPTTDTQSFGTTIAVGDVSAEYTITIGPSNDTSTMPITGLISTTVTGPFFITEDNCHGVAIDHDASANTVASCTIKLKFAPTSTGAKTGTLSVSASPGGTASIGLTGTGI